jgi:hypothetical protein
MKPVITALLVGFLIAPVTVGADHDGVSAPIRQFIDGFNSGNVQAAFAQYATVLGQPSVSLPFFVTDSQGTPVGGFTVADIAVRDDKEPAKSVIAIISPKDLPLRLGLLVQDSGSMNWVPNFKGALSAAQAFALAAMRPDTDKAFIETFSQDSQSSGWMGREQLANFNPYLQLHGSSALFDVLATACSTMAGEGTNPARRAIVLITDGHDNMSIKPQAAPSVCQNSGVVTFVLIVQRKQKQTSDYRTAERELTALEEQTGGFSKKDTKRDNAASNFTEVSEWLQAMNVVTYVPAHSEKKGHHSIEIKPISNKSWRVHAPEGYDQK